MCNHVSRKKAVKIDAKIGYKYFNLDKNDYSYYPPFASPKMPFKRGVWYYYNEKWNDRKDLIQGFSFFPDMRQTTMVSFRELYNSTKYFNPKKPLVITEIELYEPYVTISDKLDGYKRFMGLVHGFKIKKIVWSYNFIGEKLDTLFKVHPRALSNLWETFDVRQFYNPYNLID